MRLLVLDEIFHISDCVRKTLFQHGFGIDHVCDFKQLHHALLLNRFSMLLLVLDSEKYQEHALIQDLRNKYPLLPMVVAKKFKSVTDQAHLLNLGVDDCLPVPINIEELIARIHAVLRRVQGSRQSNIEHHGVRLDMISREVFYLGNKISLTRKEYCLLKYLLENIGAPTARTVLEDALYTWDEEIESNSLVVHIYRLRKKFGNKLIKTVRGFGYMIEK